MKQVYLMRSTNKASEGLFGHIICEDFHCHSGELPWQDNQDNISCVPIGSYLCNYRPDGKHRACYQLVDVDGREAVQIHVGNWCGDISKGYYSDVEGCILVGTGRNRLRPLKAKPDGSHYAFQEAVTDSATAFRELFLFMGPHSFRLNIEDRTDKE